MLKEVDQDIQRVLKNIFLIEYLLKFQGSTTPLTT